MLSQKMKKIRIKLLSLPKVKLSGLFSSLNSFLLSFFTYKHYMINFYTPTQKQKLYFLIRNISKRYKKKV